MPEPVLVTPEITSEEQILSALASSGAGFESAGGVPLMLTEAVENGVDSIIQARKLGYPSRGRVEVVLDPAAHTILVRDDGLGFLNPIHIAHKPFESLKRYDSDLTGKFARGIQGFRAFCGHLTFITRRTRVPEGENLPKGEFSGRTVRISFRASTAKVALEVVSDDAFDTPDGWPTGAIASFGDWKKGEFERLRRDVLIQRLEHHFGELIRKGEVSISVQEGEQSIVCRPVDYSEFERIQIPPVEVKDSTQTITLGSVVPELYLMQRRKRDRWLFPYLLYKDRPVGDRAICELEEFAGSSVWASPYITGFIRCDFCHINELRLALRAGYERDILYGVMAGFEEYLAQVLREHSKGLFESRMQNQINDLVLNLQDFLRKKKVFSFRTAKPNDSSPSPPEIVPASTVDGSSQDSLVLSVGGVEVTVSAGVPGIPASAQEGRGDVGVPSPPYGSLESMPHRTEVNPYVAAERPAVELPEGSPTAIPGEGGLVVPQATSAEAGPGDDESRGRRRLRKRRPHGFALVFHDDEFNEDLSWFDPATSTVIINSGHARYKQREGEELAKVKALMDYLAELYIWEITKLSTKGSEQTPEQISDQFLQTKFEFFEGRIT